MVTNLASGGSGSVKVGAGVMKVGAAVVKVGLRVPSVNIVLIILTRSKLDFD